MLLGHLAAHLCTHASPRAGEVLTDRASVSSRLWPDQLGSSRRSKSPYLEAEAVAVSHPPRCALARLWISVRYAELSPLPPGGGVQEPPLRCHSSVVNAAWTAGLRLPPRGSGGWWTPFSRNSWAIGLAASRHTRSCACFRCGGQHSARPPSAAGCRVHSGLLRRNVQRRCAMRCSCINLRHGVVRASPPWHA